MKERRGADTYMHFQCSGFLEHADQVCDRGSSYDGVVDQNDPLTLNCGFQDAQFEVNAGFTLLLGRFDESSSDIAVLIESKSKWNSGFFGISLGCRDAGLRYTSHKICFYRIRFCKRFTAADTCIVDLDAIHLAVQSCKVNIFKYTVCMFTAGEFFVGFDAFL